MAVPISISRFDLFIFSCLNSAFHFAIPIPSHVYLVPFYTRTLPALTYTYTSTYTHTHANWRAHFWQIKLIMLTWIRLEREVARKQAPLKVFNYPIFIFQPPHKICRCYGCVCCGLDSARFMYNMQTYIAFSLWVNFPQRSATPVSNTLTCCGVSLPIGPDRIYLELFLLNCRRNIRFPSPTHWDIYNKSKYVKYVQTLSLSLARATPNHVIL